MFFGRTHFGLLVPLPVSKYAEPAGWVRPKASSCRAQGLSLTFRSRHPGPPQTFLELASRRSSEGCF